MKKTIENGFQATESEMEKFILIGLIIVTLLSALVLFYCSYFLLSSFMGRKPRYGNENISFLPNASLVIASFNEEDIIRRKIDNILSIDYPKEKLEIIMVDSSTDGTREIIKKWITETDFNVHLIEEESRKGLATALNMGYAASTGEVVIKNDVDVLLEKHSIREIVKYFADPNIGGVGGTLRVSNASIVEVGYRSLYDRLRLSESNLDSTYIFEPFCAYRKELIVPLDASSVADDCEIALKIRLQGFKTVFSPTAIAYDNSPNALKSRLQQKSRRAQGHIRLILQNLKVSFNPKFGKFGFVIFPANVFMIIISPWIMLFLIPLVFLYLSGFMGTAIAFGFTSLAVLTALLIYVKSTPKALAGFLEAQIALILGSLELALKGPDFKWTKEKRSRSF